MVAGPMPLACQATRLAPLHETISLPLLRTTDTFMCVPL